MEKMTAKLSVRGLIALLILARMTLYLALPLDALHGYGDFVTFYSVAQIPGWPFLDYWVEFPPIFPLLSELLFRISGGHQHIFSYLLVMVLLAADAGNLYFFDRLARKYWAESDLLIRQVFYLAVLIALPYGWWYFDPIAVFFLLAGLVYLIEGRRFVAGLLMGAGALVKFFPLFGLAALWKEWRDRQILRVAIISVGMLILGYGIFGLFSPDFTLASLQAQSSKGSWETIWALMDGNLVTGNFGPLVERLDPNLATQPIGNAGFISPWITLPIFVLVGLILLTIFQHDKCNPVAAVGLAGCLFFLWSPGWSVQWVLYLIPLLLVGLEWRYGRLISVAMVLINLLEWPVLLSRGWFSMLPVTVIVRTFLLILAAGLFVKSLQAKTKVLIDS